MKETEDTRERAITEGPTDTEEFEKLLEEVKGQFKYYSKGAFVDAMNQDIQLKRMSEVAMVRVIDWMIRDEMSSSRAHNLIEALLKFAKDYKMNFEYLFSMTTYSLVIKPKIKEE